MLIATFKVEPAAVALADALEAVPTLEVEAERVAAHGTRWTMPCMWASNADFDAVDDALADDPSVDAVVESTAFGDEKFYEIEWSDGTNGRIDAYVDHEGSVLSARADADGWRLRIRFVSRDQFGQFREQLQERGYSYDLLTLVQQDESRHAVGGLTPAQREALRTAEKRGYFEVPREVSARELADELDMSHQNLSKLLRRATGTLVTEALETSAGVDRS